MQRAPTIRGRRPLNSMTRGASRIPLTAPFPLGKIHQHTSTMPSAGCTLTSNLDGARLHFRLLQMGGGGDAAAAALSIASRPTSGQLLDALRPPAPGDSLRKPSRSPSVTRHFSFPAATDSPRPPPPSPPPLIRRSPVLTHAIIIFDANVGPAGGLPALIASTPLRGLLALTASTPP